MRKQPRHKNRKGFTLAELVISFALIGFVSMMVSGAVTSSYGMTKKISSLSSVCYGAQNEMETELQTLSSALTEKFRVTNDINTSGETPELRNKLSDINASLSPYEKQSVTLFGKNVDIYHFSKEFEDEKGVRITLDTGASGEVVLERPVPVINTVEAGSTNGTPDAELFFSEGKKIYTSAEYKPDNYSYRYTELYQWYRSVSGDHTSYYTNGITPEELRLEQVFAAFPQEFTILPGEKNDHITVKDEYLGSFLVCAVTPLSKGGRMGDTVLSNLVYLSDLPELSSGSYKMVFDASLADTKSDPSKKSEVKIIEGMKDFPAKLVSRTERWPVLDHVGCATDSDLSESFEGRGSYSRFYKFDSLTACETELVNTSGITLYAVVRYDSGSGVFGKCQAGWLTESDGAVLAGSGSETGFEIQRFHIPSGCSSIYIGWGDFSLCELIGVSGQRPADDEKITGYLMKKYNVW